MSNVLRFGAVGDGVTDDTEAIKHTVANGDGIVIREEIANGPRIRGGFFSGCSVAHHSRTSAFRGGQRMRNTIN